MICWIDQVNGDKKYRDFIIEISDDTLIKLPEKKFEEYNELNLIGIGQCKVIIYPKYNPDIKISVTINICD